MEKKEVKSPYCREKKGDQKERPWTFHKQDRQRRKRRFQPIQLWIWENRSFVWRYSTDSRPKRQRLPLRSWRTLDASAEHHCLQPQPNSISKNEETITDQTEIDLIQIIITILIQKQWFYLRWSHIGRLKWNFAWFDLFFCWRCERGKYGTV